MLFNSFQFIFLFLPVSFVGFFVIARHSHQYAAVWLALASLLFYGSWNYHYLPLLLASILFNYWMARIMVWQQNLNSKKIMLLLAISLNLLALAYYKYASFIVSNLSYFYGLNDIDINIVLPIGISFFTFTQIAFLVDTYQGKVKESRFAHYLLFVTYFPHLIAGPVLHHKEMMPQFADKRIYRLSTENIAVGLSIFIMGLAKKVLIADNIAPYANYLFNNPQQPSFLIAWGGVLAYAFQIYFDFSGYSDMAIGLSRLFGINLPLNFNSPYKAHNIIEFWRRWHMTLSRFLRDYLYFSLGGNRCGFIRRYINLLVTMLLGGLWHGAGWTFIVWGGLHGMYLMINHLWQAIANRFNFPVRNPAWMAVSTLLTFIAVCYAWVFFRAGDLDTAKSIIQGMCGGYGIALPHAIAVQLGGTKALLEHAGVEFFLGGGSNFIETWCYVLIASVLAFTMPNTQQIMCKFNPALDFQDMPAASAYSHHLQWLPNRCWALWLGGFAMASLLSLNRPSEFLYFQF